MRPPAPSDALAASASPPAPRATIADVAAAAGVSKATVSRFLNHRDTLLSPAIAARVEAAVTALAYTPSQMAQALSRGRSRLIGLIVADVTNPYSVAVLRGAEKACQEAGFLLILFNLGDHPGGERAAIEALAGYQVDGFILNTAGQGDGVVQALARHGKPAVLVDRLHPGLEADFVSIDNAGAIQLICDHLQANGYGELLYVTQPPERVSTRQERIDAFGHCLARAGEAIQGRVFAHDGPPANALAQALQQLRQRAARRACRPAVVCGNAVMTLAVAAAVQRQHWRLGQELGLVSFDDPEWAPLIGPGLTALAQPTDALGRAAAARLLARIAGSNTPPQRTLLPGELRVRGSSAAA